MENTPIPPPPAAVQIPCPNNHLVLSILVTLLCCLPGGIVAIVYSCQVNSLYNAGKTTEAQNASKWALRWNIISIISVAVLCIIGFICSMVAYPVVLEELRNNPELRRSLDEEFQRKTSDDQQDMPAELREEDTDEVIRLLPAGQ